MARKVMKTVRLGHVEEMALNHAMEHSGHTFTNIVTHCIMAYAAGAEVPGLMTVKEPYAEALNVIKRMTT